MAITFPVSFPAAPGFARFEFIARNVVGSTRSPFTGQEQIQQHQGQWWEAIIEYPPMRRAVAEPLLAVLMQLGGKNGTFLLGDPDGKTPRGSVAGTPLVDGAGQTGQVLNTKGWTASATGVLLAGDYIQIGSGTTQRLYKVLKDVDADGGGLAAIGIWPRLRESPADSALTTISNTKGLFRLASNETPWETDKSGVYAIAFSAVEAI